jgi:hypothetical protein
VVVAWQDSQLVDVVRWLAPLPVALVPLWQLAQPLTMPLCVKVVGVHALVTWQEPHSAGEGM